MAKDVRFDSPLYTLKEVAWYLDVPENTLARWAKRRTERNDPLVTHFENRGRREAVVPFIGLAEAYVISAFRKNTKRLRMDYVLDSLVKLEKGLEGLKGGLKHALASNQLALHGEAILVNLANDSAAPEHIEVLTENRVIEKVVEGHLRFLEYAADDGLAQSLVLPIASEPLVEMNPNRAFGQAVYIKGGARMVDVLQRFNAGDDPNALAADFHLTEAQVLDTVRAFSKRAAAAA